MRPHAHLVVMAGGSGTRFWPKSTAKRPKQLLAFAPKQEKSPLSLIRSTLKRFEPLIPPTNQWIVATETLRTGIEAEAGAQVRLLAEPCGKNTAPCVYWAARELAAKDKKAVMLVMPSDHVITHPREFVETVKDAIDWAATHDDLVTLGVTPTRPETGYGYLQLGKSMGKGPGGHDIRRVEKFIEKPNQTRAEELVRSGKTLWNGGMFVWRVDVILRAFETYLPDMVRLWESRGGDVAKVYESVQSVSVDYGVMEKATNVVTIPLDCGWDDVGSWTALEGLADYLGARVGSNVVLGGEIAPVASHGNIVDAPGKLVALLDVDDLIVVETGGAILVASKASAQRIREVVDEVKKMRPDLV